MRAGVQVRAGDRDGILVVKVSVQTKGLRDFQKHNDVNNSSQARKRDHIQESTQSSKQSENKTGILNSMH